MRVILFIGILFIAGCANDDKAGEQLQQLQNCLGTANWRVVSNTDTSYIFFSQQIDNSFKTYQYNLFKGDSVNTEIGSINTNNGRVEWSFFNRILLLDDIKEGEVKWQDSANGNYVLTRQSDSLLIMKMPAEDIQFQKTLPLSTFLVRTKYDYENNLKLADSNEVKPHEIIRQ